MARPQIRSQEDLTNWLSGKPAETAQAIALRAALRALPIIVHSSENWLRNFALLPLGAVMTSWVQLTESSIDIFKGSRANARFAGPSFDFAGYRNEPIAVLAADASYHSADAQTGSMHVFTDCVKGVSSAASAFLTEPPSDIAPDSRPVSGEKRFWRSITADCDWLENQSALADDATGLARIKLWLSKHPTNWYREWGVLVHQLKSIDPNYEVWIDWFERRIRGEQAAFDIPDDMGGFEDKAILRKLAEATDEDFWGKGHEYVNGELTHWLGEVRERAAKKPPEFDQSEMNVKAAVERLLERIGAPVYVQQELVDNLNLAESMKEKGAIFVEGLDEVPDGVPFLSSLIPQQETGATAYGINAQGKLDRLPASDQMHLRDTPDQRRAYADIRVAALELQEEGQRLGLPLLKGLDRFKESLPARFEDAETYLVWRDGNALRRLYYAHRKVENSLEPDLARLEAAIAEKLGGLLDQFNNFAFADDGLREKDEHRVPPQERADAEVEANAAAPVQAAVLEAPQIATERALSDIKAGVSDEGLPADEAYSAQALDQSNRTTRNLLAGLLSGVRKAVENPRLVGFRLGKGALEGAGKAAGAFAVGVAVTQYAAILEFIATNAAILTNYVAVAYQSFPHLPDLIAMAKEKWLSIRGK